MDGRFTNYFCLAEPMAQEPSPPGIGGFDHDLSSTKTVASGQTCPALRSACADAPSRGTHSKHHSERVIITQLFGWRFATAAAITVTWNLRGCLCLRLSRRRSRTQVATLSFSVAETQRCTRIAWLETCWHATCCDRYTGSMQSVRKVGLRLVVQSNFCRLTASGVPQVGFVILDTEP